MKKLLLLSIISLFSTSIHAMQKTYTQSRLIPMTIENAAEIQKITHGRITITPSNENLLKYSTASNMLELSKATPRKNTKFIQQNHKNIAQ